MPLELVSEKDSDCVGCRERDMVTSLLSLSELVALNVSDTLCEDVALDSDTVLLLDAPDVAVDVKESLRLSV